MKLGTGIAVLTLLSMPAVAQDDTKGRAKLVEIVAFAKLGAERLSITHNSCADRGAQPDIGETGQSAPHHDVPRRRIIGAREVSA
jgi:hypothetical protein